MAAIVEQPGKRAFHRPAPRHDLKAFTLVARDLQVNLGPGQLLLRHRAFSFALRAWSEAAVGVASHHSLAS